MELCSMLCGSLDKRGIWGRTDTCMLLLLSRFSRVPLGSPVSGILQARILEWVAISFSNAWKWKAKVKSLSCAQLLATPWTAACQAPPYMGFSRQEYWNGVPLPSYFFPLSLRLPRSSGHTWFLVLRILEKKSCFPSHGIHIPKKGRLLILHGP